jgi:predicted nucleic acid-binding protein
VTAAFWDSSALVLLCVQQSGTSQSEAWAERFDLTVWWAAQVEMSSAIARLHRSGQLHDAARVAAMEDIEFVSKTWCEISPSDEVRDMAVAVLELYSLRAADSLQLAAALVWCHNRPAGRIFICADDRLCDAAAQAGFTVLRP